MSTLYFIDDLDKIVFTYSPEGNNTWRFSRLAPHQRARDLEKFVLLYRDGEDGALYTGLGTGITEHGQGWVVQDQTPGEKGGIIGWPRPPVAEDQNPHAPPLGPWKIWYTSFTLTDCCPEAAPLEIPPSLEVPFAALRYREDGTVARLELTMTSTPIVDDVLEDVLSKFKSILRNLAQRPEMVLLIRSDARESAVPTVRHIRRFLAFVQENGSEFVLVGRGNAIILASSFLGTTLLNILRLVQRLFPAPWPESTVSSLSEADEWLSKLEADARADLAAQRAREENHAAGIAREAPLVDAEQAVALALSPEIHPAEVPGASSVKAPLVESFPSAGPATPMALSPFGGSPLGIDQAVSPREMMDASSAPTSRSGGSWFCGACNCKQL